MYIVQIGRKCTESHPSGHVGRPPAATPTARAALGRGAGLRTAPRSTPPRGFGSEQPRGCQRGSGGAAPGQCPRARRHVVSQARPLKESADFVLHVYLFILNIFLLLSVNNLVLTFVLANWALALIKYEAISTVLLADQFWLAIL